MANLPFTLGVEEEYQIVNRSSRGLTSYGQILLKEGQLILGEQVHKEVMQSQIEISTNVCETVADVREELIRLRRSVHDLADEHGRAIIAASTHPFSHWCFAKRSE